MTWTEVRLGDAIHVKHGFAFKGQFFTEYWKHTSSSHLETSMKAVDFDCVLAKIASTVETSPKSTS